jgi:Flp pilus assembly protein TadG
MTRIRHYGHYGQHGQRGQSSVEFVVIFPALVLLVFGIIQSALLYQGRATLNYATLLAARAGALHNGDVGEMRNALARGLAPLFASDASLDGYALALAKANGEVAGPANLVSVQILNPTTASFNDFGRDRLDEGDGRELPNDTLAYRSTAAGTTSQQSVQDANLLHVRVTYCFRLIVPVIDRLLQVAFNSPAPTGDTGTGMGNPFGIGDPPANIVCDNPMFGGRRIYVQSEALVRMQTPFFEENLDGSTEPGTPGEETPPDTETPPDPPPPPPEPEPEPDPNEPPPAPCF